MSRSRPLYQLQQIDSEIDKSLKRIREINNLLADDTALQKMAQNEEDLRKKFEEQRHKLRAAEDQVEDQEFKIERNKKKLYGGAVTNPKELEDLQMESESLQEYLHVLEDRQLEEMLAHEQAQQAHQAAQETLEDVQQDWEENTRRWLKEKASLEQRIDQLRAKRQAHIRNIPEEDLGLYERLRQSSGGVAVAILENRSCQACGSQVPSGLAQQAGTPSLLAQCSTCGRILHTR